MKNPFGMLDRQRKIVVENMTRIWVSFCLPKYMIADNGIVMVEDVWIVDEAKTLYDEWAKLLDHLNKEFERENEERLRYAGSIGMMVPKEWF